MRSNRKSDNYIQRKVILYHNVNPKSLTVISENIKLSSLLFQPQWRKLQGL